MSSIFPWPSTAADRLSPLDASFLYLERPNELLHVGAVAILDGPVPFDKVVSTLGARLGTLARYRQRPVRAFLDWTAPRWEDDPAFDPRRHIHRMSIPAPGGDAELRDTVAMLFSRPLDPERPLWETWVLEGLAGRRTAILSKVHHCMIDGVSGAQVLDVMTQEPPAGGPHPAADANAAGSASPDSLAAGVGAGVAETGASVLARVRDLVAAASPGRALDAVRGAAAAAGVVVDFTREAGASLPFNGTLSGARRVAWASFSLDDFLVMRGAAGCKVNDVVLAVITGALARYLPARGVAPAAARVRAMIPVNVRRADEHLTLGNRVSAMFTVLPVDIADPLARLQRIARDMRDLKERGQARGFEFVLDAAGVLPASATPLLVRLNARWPAVHTVCTNVPGPREERALLGRRVLEIHPLLPLAVGIGLGFAILSYGRQLSICATADAALVPDVDEIAAGLRAAEQELRACLGVTLPRVAIAAAPGPLVGDLMTRDVASIVPGERLARAWDLMQRRRIRHLPVIDESTRVVGLITQRDLLAATPSSLVLRRSEDRVRLLGSATAAEIMETHVSIARDSEPAAHAGERMAQQKIGCLPVVADDGRLVGIVTETDFLRWATERMAESAPAAERHASPVAS